MYSKEAVDICWLDDPRAGAGPQIIGHRFSGKRKMTPDSNRRITAFGQLELQKLTRKLNYASRKDNRP